MPAVVPYNEAPEKRKLKQEDIDFVKTEAMVNRNSTGTNFQTRDLLHEVPSGGVKKKSQPQPGLDPRIYTGFRH